MSNGQTNFCPLCEGYAKRIAELEAERSDVEEVLHGCISQGDLAAYVQSRINALEVKLAEAREQLRPGSLTERAPTQSAYETACAAIEKHRERADKAEAALAEAREDNKYLGTKYSEEIQCASTLERKLAARDTRPERLEWKNGIAQVGDMKLHLKRDEQSLWYVIAEVGSVRIFNTPGYGFMSSAVGDCEFRLRALGLLADAKEGCSHGHE